MTDLTTRPAEPGEIPTLDHAEIRRLLEYYAERGWTDGLPVMPVTEFYLREFLDRTSRRPEDVLFTIPHLNRDLTVRLAAINAGLAGCLPEYFPVVVAAWEAIAQEPHPRRGIWQSTTGTAPFTVVNGPVRERIGLNGRGNIFGSGFRPNATIGRAIRLALINVFGLRPHQLDQATQGTPAKYTACIAENEEQSPWLPLHTEYGLQPDESAVTAFVIRSVIHVEARHAQTPEQLATDFADTIRRTGALIHEYTNALLVLTPEHAHLLADAGWSKDDLRSFVYDHAVRTRAELAASGKDALSHHSRWRLPGGHPDAIPDTGGADSDIVHLLTSPGSVQIVVAGGLRRGRAEAPGLSGSGPHRGSLPAHGGRHPPMRGLLRHDRRQRLAGGSARHRHRRVPLPSRGLAWVQSAPVPNDRPAGCGQPVRGGPVRFDDPRWAVLGPGQWPVLRDGTGRGHRRRSRSLDEGPDRCHRRRRLAEAPRHRRRILGTDLASDPGPVAVA